VDRGELAKTSFTSLGVRRRRQRAAAGSRVGGMGERQHEVGHRQMVGNAFGPFDQAYGIRAEEFGEARGLPLIRIRETIKIKVIEV
jgi:hypothetical protein